MPAAPPLACDINLPLQALREGDLAGLEAEVERGQYAAIQAGTFLLLEKLRVLALRRLVKRCQLAHAAQDPGKQSQLPLSAPSLPHGARAWPDLAHSMQCWASLPSSGPCCLSKTDGQALPQGSQSVALLPVPQSSLVDCPAHSLIGSWSGQICF